MMTTDISRPGPDFAARKNGLETDIGAVEIMLRHVHCSAGFGINRAINPVVLCVFWITRFYMEIIYIVVSGLVADLDGKSFGE
jgi:hypothetical protein